MRINNNRQQNAGIEEIQQQLSMSNKSEKKNNRQSYMIRKYALSESKKQPPKDPIVFMVIDDEHIGLHLPYAYSNDLTKGLIRENGGSWCHNFKIWKIPKSSLTAIRSQLPRILGDAEFEDIPLFIDRATRPIPEKLRVNGTNHVISYDPIDKRIQPVDNPLFPKLYEFQKLTLEMAIKNFGRLMIADEMGIGKTLQSLACALSYEKDWPLLIICPSALKHVWAEQIKKWLSNKIKKQYIQVVEKSGVVLDWSVLRIAIFSYEIASKSVYMLSKFNVVIVDEAHYLKNTMAQRTQQLLPFLTTRKRIFVLSGTPALAKPRQIFNLFQIIRPDIFNSLKEFGDRYCVLQRNKWSYKLEYEGCRNTAQLHYLLKNRVMIRRLKMEVLHELPAKQRQIIEVETGKNEVKKIKQLMSSKQIPLDVLRNNQKLLEYGQKSDELSPLPKCYLLSGLAKIDAVKSYLTALLQNDVKILLFAHHQVIMDQLQQHIKKLAIGYIRIDGNTSNDSRKRHVKSFQQDNSIRVAILSIMAAGVGITLTAASTVVFAELHWTPANLVQAEDRAHRIGQKSCVNIHYLVGENTLDHVLLKQLQRKLETTGDILNGNKQTLEAENCSKGALGRVSKPNFEPEPERRSQRSILQYCKLEKSAPKSRTEDSDIDEDQQQQLIEIDDLEKLIDQKQEEILMRTKVKILNDPPNYAGKQ